MLTRVQNLLENYLTESKTRVDELTVTNSQTVQPGEKSLIGTSVNLEKYASFSVYVINTPDIDSQFRAHPIEVSFYPNIDNSAINKSYIPPMKLIGSDGINNTVAATERRDVVGKSIFLYVENKDTIEHTYKVVVLGYKESSSSTPEKDNKEKVTFLSDITNSTTSNSYNVKGAKSLLLEVPKMGLGDITIEATASGVEHWTNLTVTNLDTGNAIQRIAHPGWFIVDVSSWEKIRVRALLKEPELTSVSGTWLVDEPRLTFPELIPKDERMPTGEYGLEERNIGEPYTHRVSGVDRKNSVFYAGGEDLKGYKTHDYGKTWEQIVDFSVFDDGWATNLLKLDNGALLATLYDSSKEEGSGSIYLSDENEENFQKVFTLETPGARVEYLFGLRAYKNIIVAAEYKADKSYPNNTRRAYLSTDYGKNWRKIFEGEQAPADGSEEGMHIHDICYDPYDNVIWLVQGDLYKHHHIWWTEDWGETWREIYVPEGNVPFQSTQIIPLPNCVLFGSDCNKTGVMRYDRVRGGIRNAPKAVLEQAFTIHREESYIPAIATKAAIDFNKGAAYFGFTETSGSVKMRGTVWATKNGYDFYPIYVDPDYPKGTGQVGVENINGVTDDGYILVTYKHQPEGQTSARQSLKIKVPDWE